MQKPESKRRHRLYTAHERAAIVARYRQSGQTQVGFCRQAGISGASLVEVKLPLAIVSVATLEVNGCTIRKRTGTPVEWLGSLVQKLRA